MCIIIERAIIVSLRVTLRARCPIRFFPLAYLPAFSDRHRLADPLPSLKKKEEGETVARMNRCVFRLIEIDQRGNGLGLGAERGKMRDRVAGARI